MEAITKTKIEITIKIIFSLIFIIFLTSIFIKTPGLDKNWNNDQKILSYAEINGNEIKIYNIRNITYRNTTDFDVSHYNRTVKLEDLETLDYMIEELHGFPGFAHTLLSFGFKDGSHIAISVEIRKEKGESYSPLKGIKREFELMYVIADERDVLNLRANYRNDTIYLYPINIQKSSLDSLFLSMLEKTNSLQTKPEFYNTFSSTCTTNLVEEVNKNTDEFFFKYRPFILLPGYSDNILLSRGLIKTELKDIDEARNYFNINEKAREYQYSNEFSKAIREYN